MNSERALARRYTGNLETQRMRRFIAFAQERLKSRNVVLLSLSLSLSTSRHKSVGSRRMSLWSSLTELLKQMSGKESQLTTIRVQADEVNQNVKCQEENN